MMTCISWEVKFIQTCFKMAKSNAPKRKWKTCLNYEKKYFRKKCFKKGLMQIRQQSTNCVH